MLALRSLVFNIFFYVNMVVWMLGCLIPMVLPRKMFLQIIKAHQHSWLVPLRWICGTRRASAHVRDGMATWAMVCVTGRRTA